MVASSAHDERTNKNGETGRRKHENLTDDIANGQTASLIILCNPPVNLPLRNDSVFYHLLHAGSGDFLDVVRTCRLHRTADLATLDFHGTGRATRSIRAL